jgi:hypothetical protein
MARVDYYHIAANPTTIIAMDSLHNEHKERSLYLRHQREHREFLLACAQWILGSVSSATNYLFRYSLLA